MKLKEKFAPVGVEWEFGVTFESSKANQAEVVREMRHAKRDVHRFAIAIVVLVGITIGTTALGIFGILQTPPDFGVVKGFWGATGPIFGAIVGFYFAKNES